MVRVRDMHVYTLVPEPSQVLVFLDVVRRGADGCHAEADGCHADEMFDCPCVGTITITIH